MRQWCYAPPQRCPVLVALNACVLVGLLFALAAGRQFRDGRSPWGREGRAVALWAGVVAAPAALYLLLVHADWALMYAIDPMVPSPIGPLVWLVLLAAALAAGYVGGWALLAGPGRGARGIQAAIVGFAVVLLVTLITARERIFVATDYAGFHRGAGIPLYASRLGFALLVIALGGTAAAWATVRALRSENRRNTRWSSLLRRR